MNKILLIAIFLTSLGILNKLNVVKIDIVYLIVSLIISVVILYNEKTNDFSTTNLENFTTTNDAVQAISSIYNNNNLTVTNLNVTGALTVNGVSTLGQWKIRDRRIGIPTKLDLKMEDYDSWINTYNYDDNPLNGTHTIATHGGFQIPYVNWTKTAWGPELTINNNLNVANGLNVTNNVNIANGLTVTGNSSLANWKVRTDKIGIVGRGDLNMDNSWLRLMQYDQPFNGNYWGAGDRVTGGGFAAKNLYLNNAIMGDVRITGRARFDEGACRASNSQKGWDNNCYDKTSATIDYNL